MKQVGPAISYRHGAAKPASSGLKQPGTLSRAAIASRTVATTAMPSVWLCASGNGEQRYKNGFKLTVHEDLIDRPLRWREPRLIFVNSMSDLFHEDVPAERHPRNLRHDESSQLAHVPDSHQAADGVAPLRREPHVDFEHLDGCHRGVHPYMHRIGALRMVPASVRFVSFEPLLSAIPTDTSVEGIHWAIIGASRAPGARPMDKRWVKDLKRLCRKHGTAFFFKQWGGFNKKATGRILDGRTWDEMPKMRQAVPLEV